MKTKPLNINILVRTLACSLLLLTTNIGRAGDIAQSPLFVTSSLDPNIMFIIDDSGSMNLSFVPNTLCDWDTNTNLKKLKLEIIATAASINGLAYNPATTYSPPKDDTGTSKDNSSFTSAWPDGYAPSTGTKVNLGNSGYKPAFNGNNISATGCNNNKSPDTVTPTTASKAFYYVYSPGGSGCATADRYNNSCYKQIIVSDTSGPNSSDERTNFANWYSYYRTRLFTTKAGASRAFAQLGESPRVGYGKINSTAKYNLEGITQNDTIVRGVRAFAGSDRKAFFDWLFALKASSSTPLRRAVNSAGIYFTNEKPNGPYSTTPGTTGGTIHSCQQNFTILMTDGYWNQSSTINDQDTTAGTKITHADGARSYTYSPTSPYKDPIKVDNTLADFAMYYWKNDICSSLANNVPTTPKDGAFWQHMVLYGIGLGVPTSILPSAAFDAITTGNNINWPDPKPSGSFALGSEPVARIDDLLHASVNGHGGFFNASDTDTFVDALKSTLSAITDTNQTSASAAAANSTSLQGDTLLYVAKFLPGDWYGILEAIEINQANGTLGAVNWEASEKLPAHGARNIFTLTPAGVTTPPHGSLFDWADLTPTQQGYLNKLNATATADGNGQNRLNWLRGDTSNEQPTPGIFRKRVGLLGDIVDSNPIYVGTTDYGYGVLPLSEGSDYATFRASASYTARIPTLYVGANDGMLHAFDARKNANAADTGPGGVEMFAYVPNALFPELSKLTDPNYVHQYYVDGTNGVGDAYLPDASGTTKAWHTLLAGVTGAGGQAVFALDITDPGSFSGNNVLWEYTSASDSDLGYTIGQPSIIRTNDSAHPWVVLLGNGYNSSNGHAVLLMLDAKTGGLVKKIDTGYAGTASKKNGLSTPLAVDTGSDAIIDVVYAGDLYGNMWKFDLSATSASNWDVSFNTGGVKYPLFVACTTSGSCTDANRQPITGKPNAGAVGTDQPGGFMIYFGTGKYFETGDGSVTTDPQTQSFYGIWDQNLPNTRVADRSELTAQTINFETIVTTTPVTGQSQDINNRVLSQNPICYSAASSTDCSATGPFKEGWYIDLLEGGTTANGERVVTRPLVRLGAVIFTTMIPDSDPCTGGGGGWIMLVNALTGGRSDVPLYDTNGDGVINASDLITKDGNEYAGSGIAPGIGLLTSAIVVEGSPMSYLITNASKGTSSLGIKGMDPEPTITPTTTTTPPPHPSGRQAWRQLR